MSNGTDRFDYLIVGGGMVADAAARGIRERDTDRSIGILSEDVDPPYARPALSKKLWTDPEFGWDKTDLHTADETDADIRLQTHVASIDPSAHTVTTDAGDTIGYGRLLIATGGHPSGIDGLDEGERVLQYRSADDYRSLRAWADAGDHVLVIGGSWIGLELAAALVANGASVTLVTPDATIGGGMLPFDLSTYLDAKFRGAGVEVVAGRRAVSGSVASDGVSVALDDGTAATADRAAVGLGIQPSVAWLDGSGITVDDGVPVDAELRTNEPDVLAAGDIALYPDPILGRRRVEHVDNAQAMGQQAGRNLAGAEEPYTHTPYFYSVLFGTRFEAVGRLDAGLRIIENWDERFERGIITYLDGDTPVGVLLWGIEGQTDVARAALADGVVPALPTEG